jgi:hypothetical protein
VVVPAARGRGPVTRQGPCGGMRPGNRTSCAPCASCGEPFRLKRKREHPPCRWALRRRPVRHRPRIRGLAPRGPGRSTGVSPRGTARKETGCLPDGTSAFCASCPASCPLPVALLSPPPRLLSASCLLQAASYSSSVFPQLTSCPIDQSPTPRSLFSCCPLPAHDESVEFLDSVASHRSRLNGLNNWVDSIDCLLPAARCQLSSFPS